MSDNGFRAFDQEWSLSHDRHMATDGGVRQTYYEAGYRAALAAERARAEAAEQRVDALNDELTRMAQRRDEWSNRASEYLRGQHQLRAQRDAAEQALRAEQEWRDLNDAAIRRGSTWPVRSLSEINTQAAAVQAAMARADDLRSAILQAADQRGVAQGAEGEVVGMRAVYVPLRAEVKDALLKLAELEDRDPNRQAARLIAEGLQRRGLLPGPQGDTAERGEGVRGE